MVVILMVFVIAKIILLAATVVNVLLVSLIFLHVKLFILVGIVAIVTGLCVCLN